MGASKVGMGTPQPPKVAEFAGSAPEREFRLGAIPGTVERQMKATPWMAELLQVGEGTEVLLQETVGLDAEGIPSLWEGVA